MESLDGQLSATLAAAAKQKLTTRSGGRAGTETVRAGSLPLFWLIRALWHNPQDSTRLTAKEQENRQLGTPSPIRGILPRDEYDESTRHP